MKFLKNALWNILFLLIIVFAVKAMSVDTADAKGKTAEITVLERYDVYPNGMITEFVTQSGVHCFVTTQAKAISCDYQESKYHKK